MVWLFRFEVEIVDDVKVESLVGVGKVVDALVDIAVVVVRISS